MNTFAALAIAGAAGVALYFVERRATPAAPPVAQTVPTSGSGNTLGNTLKSGATVIGTAIGGAVGAGPAAGIIGKASGGFVGAEYNAWKQSASGVSQIASGNVVTGAKNVIVGGVKTGLAPVTGAYNTIKSLF